MGIIVTLIIYLIIFGLIWWCVGMLPLPNPIRQIVQVLFVILVILMLLSVVGIVPGGHFPLMRL